MIFQTTWQQVLDGSKMQTRRMVKPGDYVSHTKQDGKIQSIRSGPPNCDGRVKWYTGQVLSVQPGRGKKAIYYKNMMEKLIVWGMSSPPPSDFTKARIKITGIQRKRLQDMSINDAIAEGIPEGQLDRVFEPIAHYKHLWNTIHTKPGTRWDDNPEVWVLEFELVETAE